MTPPRIWIWHGLRLALPADWEMLQYSTLAAHGRCSWADRNQFRLQLSWRTLPGEPDLPRMLDDYAAKLRGADPPPDAVEPLEAEGWSGILCRRSESFLTRFARFLPDRSIMAELLFIHPERGRDAAAETSVLGSFAEASGEWQAFGMRVTPPEGFDLTACDVRPAQARLVFTHPRDPLQVLRAERLGMLDAWLRAPVREWAEARVKGELAQAEVRDTGEHAAVGEGILRRAGWIGRIRRPLPCRIDAWTDPDEHRLYTAWAVGEAAQGDPPCRLAAQDRG